MITKLKLSNFKSHSNTELNIGALTVLTGMNSSGKSSVLQALLLLRQSFKKGRLNSGLDLNKPLCDIGKGYDALSRIAENDIITFAMEAGEKYELNFDANGKLNDTFIPYAKDIKFPESLQYIPLFTNDFQYLSASRWANRSLYPMDSYAVETEKQLSLEKGQAELIAHYLHHWGKDKKKDVFSDCLLHPSMPENDLLSQTTAWEREISPEVNVEPVKLGNAYAIKYSFNKQSDAFSSENVGFGLTYALPIIVAILSSQKDSLLLIENPEAHLHPRGQSKLAELIAIAAQAGIQIIIETHSDHIFNGVCKAIAQKKIDKEKAKVHYFELNDKNISINTEILFSDSGRVLNYKKGLFDQFDEDLNALLGL
jgi:predicted ATPase